ncbi:MAG TPA: metallophosphoesterase, partial [Caldilineaceae bacterium]|nr:metallophosphoesterase [Caldilineaceae bacterium]
MFDRSALPPALLEFVVIADTHYMIDPMGKQVEFNSRRRQTARTEYALQQVAALMAHETEPLIIHMGDIMQEFPEQPDFAQARTEALAQMARLGVKPRFVAGNHDVGDKPDPTMPASWVTPAFLADYHARFGRSWYSWEQAGLHFVVLNSQIMNSALPEATEQAAWLEADLAAHAGERIFLFLHLPPYLYAADEPDLGHYDNLGEPARGWLLQLIEHYRVELVFAAHVHWAYYNKIGTTRYHTTPSVAFTRPGFSELFSSPPPAEQGRDDVEKLGFFLVRVQETGSRVHFIRTTGRTSAGEAIDANALQLVTSMPADLPAAAPLGLLARHPLAPTGQVPSAWPSTIRQPVRNDYGLLALLELGARHLRLPAADLADPIQHARLAFLREHGVAVTGQWLYDPRRTLDDAIAPHCNQVDGIEVTLLGSLWPDQAVAEQLRAVASFGKPTGLSCVVPGNKVPGKQHNRSQIGYRPEQLPELNQRLAALDVTIDRLCVRLDGSLTELIATLQHVPVLSQVGAFDWLYTIPGGDVSTQQNGVAAALFAMLRRPGDTLLLEPFIDLDRTMDAGPGLLDRAYNPRPTFHLLRHLNTLLFHAGVGDNKQDSSPIAIATAETHHSLQWQQQGRQVLL